jgi:hypothetical protein
MNKAQVMSRIIKLRFKKGFLTNKELLEQSMLFHIMKKKGWSFNEL